MKNFTQFQTTKNKQDKTSKKPAGGKKSPEHINKSVFVCIFLFL